MVRGTLNDGSPLMHSRIMNGLNITMQNLGKSCSEGTKWEQHDCRSAEEQQKRSETGSTQTDLRCCNLNVRTAARKQ